MHDKSKEIHNMLSPKMEGGLFEVVTIMFVCGEFWARKDFYTVQNGAVFIIEAKGLAASGDSLLELDKESQRVGKYDKGKTYPSVSRAFSFEEMKEILKLN